MSERHFQRIVQIILVISIFFVSAQVVYAQEENILRVATKTVPPFVMDDQLAGFSIDLGSEIAKKMGVDLEYERYGSVGDLLDSVKNGNADMGLAAITINSDRVKNLDFSHPIYDSGLQILVPDIGEESHITMEMVWPLIKVLIFLILTMLLAAHAVWYFEHKKNPDFAPTYLQGVWDAFWWSAVTITTVGYGDKAPKRVFGKLVGIVWMFTGLFLIAYFTSSVTSSLTVQQLQGSVSGFSDLYGKNVATVENTAAYRFLEKNNMMIVSYPTIEEAYRGLGNKEADAFVYDAPILNYFVSNEGAGKFKTVGSLFNKEAYGIAFPQNSSLRKRVNQALLEIKESGKYDELYQRWFGHEE